MFNTTPTGYPTGGGGETYMVAQVGSHTELSEAKADLLCYSSCRRMHDPAQCGPGSTAQNCPTNGSEHVDQYCNCGTDAQGKLHLFGCERKYREKLSRKLPCRQFPTRSLIRSRISIVSLIYI